MRLILASASPRRSELLRSAGFDFDIRPADVEERPQKGESPETYTLRVATDKASEVAVGSTPSSTIVLAADTEVVVDGQILGKPVDDRHAAEMLRRLNARAHDVLTAVVVSANGQLMAEVVTTRVWFTRMSDDEVDWYVRSGEPRGKAGAYAIQGLGARFIERIDGSWSNVVGLPIHAVHRLLTQLGAR